MSTAPPDRYFNSLISGLPPEVLSKLPAVAPPPGVTSNFVNPVSRGWVLTLLSALVVYIDVLLWSLLSIYYRVQFLQNDDITWNLLNVRLMLNVELYIGIMLCCLQPMAIFFYKYRNRFSSAISGLALGLASGITCCLCCGSGSRSSANSDATVDEKQDPSVALPARARLPEPNLYPGLDLTTPSELERGGFRRSHLNSMDIRTNHSGGANSIPSHELLHWA
ncbi:hypothetical protein EYC84_001126 [Monilinia fructicola]|uniref:Uncharacterized protein n=1 Tax=Monilinia fructicola TaxID=38448 RepID=A0A5M9JND2_MONFR|nr:hypothetical protein EYC84_001126 [Monilinia fructicola]